MLSRYFTGPLFRVHPIIILYPRIRILKTSCTEFMLIVSGLEEETLKARFEQINDALENDVHFAFGYYYVNEGEDIRAAMRIADERMYSDKNEYYEQHPERKYR